MKTLTELLTKTARLLYEAFMFLEKAAREAIGAISNAFAAVFKGIPQSQQKADIPRRNWLCRSWTRPRNRKIHLLMLDRRNRIFHCRNAI